MSASSKPSFGSLTGVDDVPEPLRRGERLGKYRLCYQLAAGGMGTVYLARAEGPHGYEKLVALKRIHPHLASDQKFVAMFLDEARIAARIGHPNVCGVIDFGEAEGSYYFAMPYLMGESASRVIRDVARLGPHGEAYREAPALYARVLADACEGLHAAHELTADDGTPLEVVHRDISPHNLFIGYDGVARVLDFGVASAAKRLHSTVTGEVKGKFAYMSPEQLDGEVVDRRADVWSLGVVLYEALSGKRLFGRGNMTDTIRAVLTLPVPPISDFRKDVPIGLEEIVFRALSRDREMRYPTARAMGRDLATFLVEQGRTITSADVAEWMTSVYPDGLAEKRRLVDQAKEALAAQEPQTPAAPGSESASGPVRRDGAAAGRGRHRREDPTVGDIPLLVKEPRHEGTAGLANPGARVGGGKRMSTVALVLSVALVASAVTGAGIWFAVGGTESVARDASGEVSGEAESFGAEAVPAEAVPAEAVDSADSNSADSNSNSDSADSNSVDSNPAEAEAEAQADEELAEEELEEPAPASNRRSAVARGPGTLRVATPGGWAIVSVGGRRLGEAPGTFELPAGRHVIELQPFGQGARMRRRVRVPAGGTARVSVPVAGR